MTLDSMPAIADNIIKFDGTPGRAAMLNYSVPLPGRLVGRRAVLLDLGLPAAGWSAAAQSAGVNVAAAINLQQTAGGTYAFDPSKAIEVWIEHAVLAGVPGDQIDAVKARSSKLEADFGVFAQASRAAERAETGPVRKTTKKSATALGVEGIPTFDEVGLTPYPDDPGLPPGVEEVIKYLNGLVQGKIALPKGTIGGKVGSTTTTTQPPATTPPPAPQSNPQLMLLEIYCISSFLGDYGLGRTVKTFTLLPGESTNISLKTWRSSEQKQAEASTILDSFQETAASKFRGAVQSETSSRAGVDTTNAAMLNSVSVDLIFGLAKVQAGGAFGTETHATRDDFTKSVMDVVHEHANEASSKRENSVTSSSESSEKRGEETVTERTIKNVNLRRVLNFVFRELNQEYLTKVHLKEIRVAFTNGRPFSYRETPLSGLRKLLQAVLVPAQVDPMAQKILKNIGVVFDVDDDAVPVLEKVTMSPDGQAWTPAPATMTNNEFPPPTDTMFYRYKRGALGQEPTTPNPVEGVLLEEDRVTLRTDSVVVEALLGEADALDQYAMEMQRAEAEARTLANKRETAGQAALAAITAGAAQSDAFAEMFNQGNPVLRIELVKNGP